MTILFRKDRGLTIQFEPWERVWAIHPSKEIQIPVEHITRAWLGMPKSSWKELRVPGSFIPGLIKAGTYITPRGKEFWYVTRKKQYAVTIELTGEPYARLVLGVERPEQIVSTGLILTSPPGNFEMLRGA